MSVSAAMNATILDLEALIVSVLEQVPGIEKVVDHEPQKLPKLPCITLLATLYDPIQAETGTTGLQPHDDVFYAWRCRVYVALNDYEKAQLQMKALVPNVIALGRAAPTADGLADFLRIRDAGGEPVFSSADGWMAKDLTITAMRTEGAT